MQPKSFSHILFDWGDTVMYDDPTQTAPMVDWSEVRKVPGIDKLLADLKSTGRAVFLATSADVSSENQIRAALARVSLDHYFDGIFSTKNTGLPKGEAFYRCVLTQLGVEASQVLMIGDSFAKDVLAANAVGIAAVWFNEQSPEESNTDKHVTFHTMNALFWWLH